MRTSAALALVSITLSSVAMADPCCKPAGCSPSRDCLPGCRPVVKKVDITATCYNIEHKTICIPPTRFPWDPTPCDGVCCGNCGAGCKCGTNCGCAPNGNCGAGVKCAAGGACTPAGRRGAGCGNACKSGGLFSGLREALGLSNCATSRCVKSPKKSSKKIGEKCVCEWVTCSNDVCDGAGCKPACAAPSVAPPSSTPAAPPQQEPPMAAPAPPEAAALRGILQR